MARSPARNRRLTQAERTELSDRRMIESAIQLIVDRGVLAATLTDIGIQAGYSRGLAAMRFGTKAGLLRCVARHVTSNWVSRLRKAVGNMTGLAAVLAAIDSQERAIAETPSEMRALYAIYFQSCDPSAQYHLDVAHSLTAQRRDLANWLREAQETGEIARKTDTARIANQILSSMLGIVYQWMMDPDLPTGELHRDLKDMLCERFAFRFALPARR